VVSICEVNNTCRPVNKTDIPLSNFRCPQHVDLPTIAAAKSSPVKYRIPAEQIRKWYLVDLDTIRGDGDVRVINELIDNPAQKSHIAALENGGAASIDSSQPLGRY
jgi:hypothetical protein